MSDEPAMTINGVQLSIGQSMAVRCAITMYHAEMCGTDNPVGTDEHGIIMQKLYRDRLDEVITIIMKDAV